MPIKCPKCNSENPDRKQFCGDCGTQLTPAESVFDYTQTLVAPEGELARGTTFANRYEIIEELGRGGMGKVFRAYDKQLKEEVALKLIKPEIASDKKTVERFGNELKIARRIIHKNVGRMYELMEDKDSYFITMEYIAGEDLKSFIKRSGKLATGTVLSIAKQVCKGLAEAHRLGIVHRDLKPSNIMVDKDGNARIMDFGIALSLKTKGITGKGVIIGTPEYMSPEQVEGKEVDQRSDIYSLGIILYEMLTGRVPFEGDSLFSIAMKHKGEEPQDPRKFNVQIPALISRVILKCIEKDKEKRFQTAEELFIELTHYKEETHLGSKRPRHLRLNKRVLVISCVLLAVILLAIWIFRQQFFIPDTAKIRSVAVLPFLNLSNNPEDESFADGITEEMISKLAILPGLRVSSRTASFHYKSMDIDIKNVGKKLGVKAVLEGSIRRYGDRLRVTAQLIKVEDGFHIWAEDFDREWNLDDILKIQDDVARNIASALKIRLTPTVSQRLSRKGTINEEAYELYLRGTSHLTKGGKEEHVRGIKLLQQAIDIDPKFTDAHARLSIAFLILVEWGYDPDPRWLKKAEEEALRALSLNPELPAAYEAFLVLSYQKGEPEEIRNMSKKLLSLDPNNIQAHFYLGYLYMGYGFLEEGKQEYEFSLRSDPFFLPVRMNLSMYDDLSENYAAGVQKMRKLLEEYPGHPLLTCFLAYFMYKQGRVDEAISLLEPLKAEHPLSHVLLAMAYSKTGELQKSRQMETPEMQRFVENVPWWPSLYLAQMYALMGRDQETMDTIERMIEFRGFPFQALENWSVFGSLRKQDRFLNLIEKAKIYSCEFAEGDDNLRKAYQRLCGSRH